MNDAKRFLEIIKTAAVEAVEQRYPVEFMLGVVIQEEDKEKDIPLLIELQQKLKLKRSFFIENSLLDGLKEGDKLAILRIQGGQKYYVMEVLPDDT